MLVDMVHKCVVRTQAGEPLELAVAREVEEEAGVKVDLRSVRAVGSAQRGCAAMGSVLCLLFYSFLGFTGSGCADHCAGR